LKALSWLAVPGGMLNVCAICNRVMGVRTSIMPVAKTAITSAKRSNRFGSSFSAIATLDIFHYLPSQVLFSICFNCV